MRCEQCRQGLSARLDNEEAPADRGAVDEHLAGCADCRHWLDDAAAITRLARLAPAIALRGIDDLVLAAAPGPGRRKVADALWLGLGIVGAAQLVLGLQQISGHGPGQPPGSPHLFHESAAWNVALGAGFAWMALRRTRPSGMVALLTAFVTLMTLLSINDLWHGAVGSDRLMTHSLVLVGYVITLLLSRPGFDFSRPQGTRGEPRWRAHFDDEAPPNAAEAPARPDRVRRAA